jgi:predicted dehydrogenase
VFNAMPARDSNPKPVRVGIVGAGANTRAKHIPELKAIPGVELRSVCNRSRESSARAAAAFGIPEIRETWQELVRDDGIDAVVIGTWPYLHAPVTLAALEAGKHVLCEARMAMDLREARAMLAAHRRHPALTAQIVPAPFTLEADPVVTGLIHDGFAGRLLAVEVRAAGGAFVDRAAPLHWRQDATLSGLNIMSLGIWYESLMRWVGTAAAVYAQGLTAVPERRDAEGRPQPVAIPDHLDVVARMACGAQAHFLVSAVTGAVPSNRIALYGEDGTLVFDDGRLLGARRGEDRLRAIPVPPLPGTGWRVEREFIDSIRGATPVARTTFEDGVRYMAFTEAVHLSMRAKREVAVEGVG